MKHVVRWRERRRCQKFEGELVAGLTFINNALRAGLGLAQAIEVVAHETEGAFAQEMLRLSSQQHLGRSLAEALADSARTTPVPDWKITVQACLILTETGGNLIESFQLILETIRDRQRVSEKIRTATTSGRVQAMIISVMPFGIAAMLASFSPEYIRPLIATPMGWGICAMGGLLLICGIVWMRAILDLEV